MSSISLSGILKPLIALLCGLGISSAHAFSTGVLIGSWRYDGFFYEGQRFPNPNPELKLDFTFYADGTDRLYWARDKDPGFCERLATYQVVENHLLQKITWVNPKNQSDCAADVDMQLGRETDTVIFMPYNELWFQLSLKGKPFEYILKSLP